MTPAIKLLVQQKIQHNVHEYEHDPEHSSYGLEAAEKLGVPPERVFKTLLVDIGARDLAVGVIPVSSSLSLKTISKVLGAKRAQMADSAHVERSTGYVLGGVSPLAQRKLLRTIIDSSAETFSTIFVSGGRRGLEIELSPLELKELVRGEFAPIREV